MERDAKIHSPMAAPPPPEQTPGQSQGQSPAPCITQSIALVGLMGAGKTTVGRRLAARLGLPFVDADAEIETACGMTVSEIFERFGEAHFRDGERRVIARLVDGPTKVIATGGGAFVQDDTRALLLARTTTIWLDVDVATLVARVRKRDTRPLLKGRDPGEVLAALAAVRNPFYAQAALRIPGTTRPHGDTVASIIAALALTPGEVPEV